jgi:hypothetical protein
VCTNLELKNEKGKQSKHQLDDHKPKLWTPGRKWMKFLGFKPSIFS